MNLHSERLDYIDNMLLASGWKQSEIGWIAPEKIRPALASVVGVGHVSRSIAVSAQIQIDEKLVA